MSELLQPDTQRILNKHDSNLAWYKHNFQKLKEVYKGQIILVIDENVVEGYKDINALRERLKRNDIDARTVTVDYISDSDMALIY
jgi:hypothetical protein